MTDFDVLIAGGGAAGCVLAARLSEDGRRSVCLIEAGPDYGPHEDGGWPADMLDPLAIPDSHDWTDRNGRLPVARIIGGCSSHNFCIAALPRPEDYDDWELPDWTGNQLAPYVDRVLETLPMHRFAETAVNPWYASLREAAAQTGLPVHEDLNSPDAIEGIGPLPLNVRETTRWNAAFSYLDRARGRSNLTVLPETTAELIELEHGRATAVLVRTGGERRRLTGERVIVAAGAYNSPALLLRSGIGPENERSRHGIEPVATLPVGERLREHFGVPLRFAPSEEMRARIERHHESNPPFPFNGVIKARTSSCPPERWDVILLLGLFPGPILSASVMLMRPEWSGRVTLRSTNPEELPVVSELSLDSDRDLDVALEGLELGRRLARAGALDGMIETELSPGPDATAELIRASGRDALTTFFHPVGTCPMGAVTEPDGRVRGFRNLYVGDGSILPEIPPVPTHVTVLAVAEKLAAEIAASP